MSSNRVLLLNASYEPLRTVSLYRAIVLMFEDKVDVVENVPDEFVRSPSMAIPKPSVVRLRQFVHVPAPKLEIPISNKRIFERDKYECAYAHIPLKDQKCEHMLSGWTATVDHVQPRSKGGKHDWSNVVTSCKPHNAKKGNKLLSELGWTLQFKPGKPDGLRRWLVIDKYDRDRWESYLAAFNR